MKVGKAVVFQSKNPFFPFMNDLCDILTTFAKVTNIHICFSPITFSGNSYASKMSTDSRHEL